MPRVRAAAELIDAAETELRRSPDRRDIDGIKERIGARFERIEAAVGRRMMRGTGILATIGATAPFVGLFGTVWGIMNSFIGISKLHTTNLAVVAPGIAEALLATAFGLVAAIPAVVIYNLFARSIAHYRALLADAAAGNAATLSAATSSQPPQAIDERRFAAAVRGRGVGAMSVRLDHGEDELDEVHEINVTPFIDVMLVLLIIFMIAAPLATVDVAVDLPASNAERQPRPDKPIFLTIKSDLSWVLGDTPVARDVLAKLARRALQGRPQPARLSSAPTSRCRMAA